MGMANSATIQSLESICSDTYSNDVYFYTLSVESYSTVIHLSDNIWLHIHSSRNGMNSNIHKHTKVSIVILTESTFV